MAAPPAPAPAAAPAAEPETPVAKVTPRPWPQASSDIAPDKGATFGSLPNGLRYLIYPNAEPPRRVSLRLHIAAGALMEQDDQRGVAHFLEHMMFNGNRHFSAKDLVPHLQRFGISFGSGINAYTSFNETVYMLDLPEISEDLLKLGFTVMRDFGDGANLAADEIDSERGIILAEKISRDTVGFRIMEQRFNKLLPEGLAPKRFPIGIEEVIKSAPRERFADFYTRYYTPARMTFVVVGDVKPDEIRSRIEAVFGSMVQPAQPGANPDLGKITQPNGLETSVFHDKELSSTQVSLTRVGPFTRKPDTRANRTGDLPLDLAHAMLNRRFERITKEKNSPLAQGSASKQELFHFAEIGTIGATAAADRWQEVVPIVEREFRRALQHGFTTAELDEAKSNLLNRYEQEVKQKATRKSEALASELAKSINDEQVLSAPETNLEIAKRGLAGIDVTTCHRDFKAFWEAPGYHLILTTKEKPLNAEMELAKLFETSRGTPVEPPVARATQKWAYQGFGTPGTVVNGKVIEDLGIAQLLLSNNIRVNLKRTDFEQGKIRMHARIGAGKLSQPKDMPMLDTLAQAVFEGGGLGTHSIDDLQQILAGKNVGCSLAIGDDAFTLGGTTTKADFADQCQLMCASITDPGYREEALWQFQKTIPMIYQQMKHTPAGPKQEIDSWLHGGDSRYSIAPQEKLSSYTVADAKNWLTPELAQGYVELTIIGDFEMEKVLPDLLATFGALPARATTAPQLADARKVNFPKAPATKSFTYESKIPQAIAIVYWKTAGVRDNQKECRRLNLLAQILSDRLREEIREKLGASYSPRVTTGGSEALEGMGYLSGQSIGKPADLEKLLNTMREQADQLATKGATADEFERVFKPGLGQLEKSQRDNSYWLGTVMSQCQAEPIRLALARDRVSDYQSITLAEINALAKKYLAAESALMVTVQPTE